MAVYFKNIIGNEKLKGMLSSYIQNNNMPHAFIIEGAKGSGKKTLAKSIAAALSCKNKDNSQTVPCFECINCEKIFKDISPDVIVIDTNSKNSIGVDIVRELKNHTYMTSNELDYKAYIIDEADKMTQQAQNAFLKILEEPVTNVIYFLLCENAQTLLQTVISRAPVIRTTPLKKDEVIDFLTNNEKLGDTQEVYKLASISCGNIGKALEYSKKSSDYTEISELRDKAYAFLSLHAQGTQKSAYLIFFSEIDDKGGFCTKLLMSIYSAVRDIIAYKTFGGDSFDFFIDINDIKQYEKAVKIKYAKKLCILIEQTIGQLQLNQGASSANSIMQNFAVKAWSTRNQ